MSGWRMEDGRGQCEGKGKVPFYGRLLDIGNATEAICVKGMETTAEQLETAVEMQSCLCQQLGTRPKRFVSREVR